MYHGSQICGNCYASSNVAWFDYCDKDRMSMIEIDNMVRELGYDGVISYWYSIPTYSNGCLKFTTPNKLNDDQDVIDMLVFVPETRLIDIFLHHGVDGNEGWFYSQSGSNLFVDLEADIVPNKGIVIEELDDNYGAIVPVGGKCKQWRQHKKTSVVIEDLNEDPNGEQSGGGMQKARESSARQGVSEKGKEKAVERESSAVQTDKEKAV
ncbi:hypothetical protein CerSpe_214340 [Prunus speciosa]